MLDKRGVDLWTDDYNKAVGISDEEKHIRLPGIRMCLIGSFKPLLKRKMQQFSISGLEQVRSQLYRRKLLRLNTKLNVYLLKYRTNKVVSFCDS